MVRNPYLTLTGTEEECSYSPGSVKTVKVARAEEVDSVPVLEGEAPITNRPVAYFPESFVEYRFRPDSVIFSESGKQTSAGMKYEQRVRGIHPGSDSAAFYEIARLMDGHYILIIELYSGPIRLLGTTEAPFQFSSDFTTGDKLTDTAQTTWEFYGDSNAPAPTLADLVVTTASPCALLSPSDFLYQPWTIDTGSNYALERIYVDANPGGLITSITSRPDGILYDNTNTAVDTLEWNGAGYYEPANGPWTIVGTWRAVIADIPVSTGSPSTSCEITFNQQFTLANSPPELTFLGWSGLLETGETLSAISAYFDADGDGKNNAATNGSLRWYQADDASGTGETLLATATSYTLVIGNEGKYIELRGVPHANAGATPGAEKKSGWIGPVPLSNEFPVASSLSISGTAEVGSTLTANYTYSDGDGDAIDLAGTDLDWYKYDDAGLTTGETLIQSGNAATGDTYDPVTGDNLKYIAFKITPAAVAGNSPGLTVKSPGVGPVSIPLVKIATLKTHKETSVNIKVAYASTVAYELRLWDDHTDAGAADSVISKTGVGNLDNTIFTFGTAGLEHRIEIWGASASDLHCLDVASMEITYVDLSSAVNMGSSSITLSLNLSSNSISTLALPSTIGNKLGLNLSNAGSFTSLNISGWRFLNQLISINFLSSLTTFVGPTTTTSGDLQYIEFRDLTNCTSTIDLTGCAFRNSFEFQMSGSSSIPGFLLPDLVAAGKTTKAFRLFSMNNVAFTAAHADKIKWEGTIQIYSNSKITDLGSSAAGSFTPTFGATDMILCQLAGMALLTQSIDFSLAANSRTYFNISNLSALGTFTMPTSNDKTFTTFFFNNNNQSNVDISGFTVMSQINSFVFECRDMGLAASVVNNILDHLVTISTSGYTSRTANLAGNAAPTTGPPNGIAAKADLVSVDGFSSVTTA